jgi:predicted nucleotidyltransferase
MRLTASEIAAIREEVGRLDPKAEVYLYGSRVDDTARGGDVDLLVISETLNAEVRKWKMNFSFPSFSISAFDLAEA